MLPHIGLEFAPPEVVLAFEDAQPCLVRASHDVFSIGALAFAYLAHEGPEQGALHVGSEGSGHVFQCARQQRRYPWEHRRAGAAQAWHASALSEVFRGCLERSASLRPSASELLARLDAYMLQQGMSHCRD